MQRASMCDFYTPWIFFFFICFCLLFVAIFSSACVFSILLTCFEICLCKYPLSTEWGESGESCNILITDEPDDVEKEEEENTGILEECSSSTCYVKESRNSMNSSSSSKESLCYFKYLPKKIINLFSVTDLPYVWLRVCDEAAL